MGAGLIIGVTVAYLGVAINFYLKGDNAMCLVFVGYFIANLGFIYAALRT